MAYDRIYYFEKHWNGTYSRKTLGEIQTDFNMSKVIDGTKDSLQVIVNSYVRDALIPNTIIWHENTNTWWIAKKDNVKRNANEIGFYYNHTLTLLGAIDLLANRDLIDTGYNANNYTIKTFIEKLFKCSTFEFNYEIHDLNSIDLNKNVDYVKSYENYTLLTALRDFLNGYNCDIKLSFTTRLIAGQHRIFKAIFVIIPRTGRLDLEPIDISHFDDIRESINYDKESFGTTVVSNAQNVISTQEKTFPQVGGVRITGSDYDTTISSAYIKLPSQAYRVNWVKAICPMFIYVFKNTDPENVVFTSDSVNTTRRYYPNDYKKAIKDIKEQLINAGSGYSVLNQFIDDNENKIKELFDYGNIVFYNNPSYNPRVNFPSDSSNGSIQKEKNTPYITILDNYLGGSSHKSHQVALMDNESASLLRNPSLSIIWERGSNKITNIDSIMSDVMVNIHYNNSEYYKLGYHRLKTNINGWDFYIYVCYWYTTVQENSTYWINYQRLIKAQTVFQVNYIPMSDVKIKQDNEKNTNDIQLYNQNGKLNDSVALSKMVDSYSKEIQNPTITRYMHYTNIENIPTIGQIVMDGNTKYVINNISYDFYYNESNNQNDVGYYIECEFTLAEYVSTKSIMTSPNTNVRDYGIPQKYNIKRRQVYRDYYEFDLHEENGANLTTPYAKLGDYLPLSYYSVPKEFDHTAIMKITYDDLVDNQSKWYFQLNSTVYIMNKAIYEIIDFDDNNIIGYDIQNSTTGFNMSDLWSSNYRAVTTPVSYVDDNGKFKGITLQMVGKEKLEQAYASIDTQGEPVMFSAHCFIDKSIYNIVGQNISDAYNDERTFNITTTQLQYGFTLYIDPSDIGLPDDYELNADNFIGFDSVDIKVDGNSVTPTGMGVANFDYNGSIAVLIVFLSPYSIFGTTSGTITTSFKIKYLNETNGLADYVIDEQDYEKDAIEVPVFEYSLQIGDSKECEIGDTILQTNKGIASLYTMVVKDKNTVSQLNASAFAPSLTAYSEQLVSPTDVYDCDVFVDLEHGNDKAVKFELDTTNNLLKITGWTYSTLVFVGVESDQTFVLNDAELSSQQIEKNDLIDKDIVIFKHTINKITCDTSDSSAEIDYDTDLMYIIHAPQNANFDGDTLQLNINYYKLK